MWPSTHPERTALHNEVHARPPEAMTAPLALSHVVMLVDDAGRQQSREHLRTLLKDHHLPIPDDAAGHLRTDIGGTFKLRWELHTEFVSWTFWRPFDVETTTPRQPPTAFEVVPKDWLAGIPGTTLVSHHLWVLPGDHGDRSAWLRETLHEDTLVASGVAGGRARAYTDFSLHADGSSRLVLLADDVTPRQLGRLVQQLVEVETYRMAALLGLPAARMAAVELAAGERSLAELATAIRAAAAREEPMLLDRLTKLAANLEGQYAETHSRFSASAAYFELVDRRIADLAEARLNGLQTMGEFLNRRISPARATCAWTERRQDALSQRVSRISTLLRTRVEIEQQENNRQLLAAMNRRQGLQLKLQATVEGLSVAAITYYIAGLVSYLAKGAHAIGWPWSGEATAACAIPLIAMGVWWSLRGLHQRILDA